VKNAETDALVRELDVLRGALRTACTVIRKMKRGQNVDTPAFFRIANRALNEARDAVCYDRLEK